MKTITKLKQWLCGHEVWIHDIRKPDPNIAYVFAPCRKCGKILSAPYGLAIPAVLCWQHSL